MEFTIDLSKSLEENAAEYFDKAKKARKKIDGVKETIARYEKELEELKAKRERGEVIVDDTSEQKDTITNVTGKWFDKYKWFISSEGFLVVAGKDASSNESIVTKHVEKDDIVFHTDMAGSPFVVIKMNKDDANDLLGEYAKPEITEPTATIEEAATFCLVHGRPWKLGLATESVFSAAKEQLLKKDPSGVSLPKGSFYVDGKTTRYSPSITYAIGVINDMIVGGPQQSIDTYDEWAVTIQQGNMKTGLATKEIKTELLRFHKDKNIDLNAIMNVLPAGGVTIVKRRKMKSEL